MSHMVFGRVLVMILTVWAWSNVLAATEVRYEWPSVNGLPVNNACATDETFRSLAPVRVCTETAVVARHACHTGHAESCRPLMEGEAARADEAVREDVRCVAREPRSIEVSREIVTVHCDQAQSTGGASSGPCAHLVERKTKVDRSFEVRKYELRQGDASDAYLGTERFIVPECGGR